MKKLAVLQSIAYALELRKREADEMRVSEIVRSASRANLVFQNVGDIA